MADRTQRTTATNMRTVVDPKMSLSLWLRAGRAAKGLSLEDVAKITKIQPRILERLEAGKLDGLPAEVFVRGFVRSYARCCGLDESEALERYAQAASPASGSTSSNPSAGMTRASALVESMSELAPTSASRGPRVLTEQLAAGSLTNVPKQETVVETMLPESGTLVTERVEVVDVAPPAIAVAVEAPAQIEAAPVVVEGTSKKKRGRGDKGRKGRKRNKQMAEGTPSSPMPIVAAPTTASIAEAVEPAAAEPAAVEAPLVAETAPTTATLSVDATTDVTVDVTLTDAASAVETSTSIEVPAGEVWSPKMPVVTPSVPWRRPASTLMSMSSASAKAIIPSIVIDDADPESAEREIEDRAAAKEPARRSFLPPILLDREDRSARQGGLTLAVIILLIAATLTLSYLMRRPSSTGDGVTMIDQTTETSQTFIG